MKPDGVRRGKERFPDGMEEKTVEQMSKRGQPVSPFTNYEEKKKRNVLSFPYRLWMYCAMYSPATIPLV